MSFFFREHVWVFIILPLLCRNVAVEAVKLNQCLAWLQPRHTDSSLENSFHFFSILLIKASGADADSEDAFK